MKILVIDDNDLVRGGLCQVLKGLDKDVEVLQAGNCAQGFELARTHLDLDLVMLDYHLPDMTGLAALDLFGKSHPELPVLMLSGSANIQIMRQALKSGAAGFVVKTSQIDELLGAVRRVLDGEVYVPPVLDTALTTELPDATSDTPPMTARQELVLRELLEGRSDHEIGLALNVSDEIVKTHVAAILLHFDVQDRMQAVIAAARCGYKSLSQQ